MVKTIKKTIYYAAMSLEPLKMGKISILTSRKLIKKILIKRREKMAKIIWKGLAKKDNPIYSRGFIISSPKIRRDINKPKTNKEDKNRKSNKTHNINKRKYTSISKIFL